MTHRSLIYPWCLLSRVGVLLAAVVAVVGTLAAPALVQAANGVCNNPPPQFPGVSSFKDEDGNWNDVDNPYFPLEPGTTFTYEGTKDGDPVVNVVHVTHKTKTVLGVRTIVVHDLVYISGALAEATFDYFAQDRRRNVWYFGEDSTEIPSGDKTGSWLAGVQGALPGIIMEGHPRVGDQYLQESAPQQGAQDRGKVLSLRAQVTVPYGSFTRVLKTRDGSCLEDPSTDEFKFFAPGVGNIKLRSLDGNEEQHLVSITDNEDSED